jgi:hypothetical protein
MYAKNQVRRSRAFWGVAVLALLAVQSAFGAADSPPSKKPKEFPPVAGIGKSVSYATVSLDTWTSRVAYLLVEGNTTSGFTRVFAWIPGDARMGRPVEWKTKATEGNPNIWNFGELENKGSEGEEKIRMAYRFYTVKESHGAGTQTTMDYVTGKAVTRNWGAATYHRLLYSFSFGYAYGTAPSASMDGGYPLEIGSNGGDVRLYAAWEQVPPPGGGPGHAIIRAKHTVQESRDPKRARVLVQFEDFAGAAIKKAPTDLTVSLIVAPYMGEPVYSNSVPLNDFMKTGFDVDLPYGWYSFRLSGFKYGRFTFTGDFPHISINPIPISRPSLAGEK